MIVGCRQIRVGISVDCVENASSDCGMLHFGTLIDKKRDALARAYSEGGELAQQIGYPIYEHTIYALVDGYYRPSSTEACHGWRSDERVIIMCTVVIRPLKTSLNLCYCYSQVDSLFYALSPSLRGLRGGYPFVHEEPFNEFVKEVFQAITRITTTPTDTLSRRNNINTYMRCCSKGGWTPGPLEQHGAAAAGTSVKK